jgi:hypothetical protein
MSDVTDVQLALAAYHAGWRGTDLRKAIAIAFAECGGKVTTEKRGDVALQTRTWGPSIGPWQIRSLNAQKGTGGERDEIANQSLPTNAQHAYAIWREAGNSFSPWTTAGGAFMFYWVRAGTAAGRAEADPTQVGGGGPGDPGDTSDPVNTSNPLTDAAGAAKNAVKMLAEAGAWIADPHNWMRIAQVTVGGAVVIAGLAVIVGKPAKELAGVVKP